MVFISTQAQSSWTNGITLLSLLSDYLYAMLTESHQPTTHFSRPCKLDLKRLKGAIWLPYNSDEVRSLKKWKGAREAAKPRNGGDRYWCGSWRNCDTILSSSRCGWPELGSSTAVAEWWVSSWKHTPAALPYKLNGPWTIPWHRYQYPTHPANKMFAWK